MEIAYGALLNGIKQCRGASGRFSYAPHRLRHRRRTLLNRKRLRAQCHPHLPLPTKVHAPRARPPAAPVDLTAQLAALLFMPAGAVFDDMLDLARELQSRNAELLIISDASQALSLAKTPLPIAGSVPEWLSPIVAILPGQLLALHLALNKGFNPDV